MPALLPPVLSARTRKGPGWTWLKGPCCWIAQPTDHRAPFNLGLGYRKLEPPQHGEALHYFRAALAITPQDAKLQMQVAKTYEDSGQLCVCLSS